MTKKTHFKYIYGPVLSWRLGCSLGVDLIAYPKKICTFDCIYCQLGRKPAYKGPPKVFVPVNKIIKEMRRIPKIKIDYITFSGMGEPTLAKNLKSAIQSVRKIRQEPIAILTNASLIHQKATRKALALADCVICKLDAYSQKVLEEINAPAPGIKFEDIIKGMHKFKKSYKGKLALQMMVTRYNKNTLLELAKLAKRIQPDEIQINTPLRPCGAKPLPPEDILKIKRFFTTLVPEKVICVYDRQPKKYSAASIGNAKKRRPVI